LDVIEQHAYTTELRLTYALRDPVTGEPDPSAYLRAYHDARQVEATHCYVGRRWQDVLGMYPPAARVVDHRLRMNTFLGKWLHYLAEGGHGVATLQKTTGPTLVEPAAWSRCMPELRVAVTRIGVPTGIRTPVSTVKGWCPRPLDDGDEKPLSVLYSGEGIGGARRDRTADLLHAMQALSQLSYGPTRRKAGK